ncbi:hexosaminidase D-like [Ctenocephalides felis]|uniref:hexosaminidase D-like n=1 Tax=Ctenocephalides felis TaxID=7515 RepID=UPI000E6E1AB0|nr:hexosaminidase D-like [Ctenocephalides felis]
MQGSDYNSHRLVHLDLKGAPPKISYFEQLIPVLRNWGATGILLEWEDTFPYHGELIELGSLSASSQENGFPYTEDNARNLISIIESNGLAVIPLIQTFGHMEFLLKHEKWYNLREVDKYPSSICPSHPETLPVIKKMLDQIISFHQNLQYIHIGCDEVWHLGLCQDCSNASEDNPHKKYYLFLNHLVAVANYIKTFHPNITIIIWDDMLRSIPLEILNKYNIGNLVEPMVWCYLPKEVFNIDGQLLEKYHSVFQHIWIASAFKGATSSCQIIPDKLYHVSNHQAWLEQLTNYSSIKSSLRGIAFTGWSRFDHYATLCELLPVGLPSLALCMKTWINRGYSSEVLEFVEAELGYQKHSLKLESGDTACVMQHLKFPGSQIAICMESLFKIRHRVNAFLLSDLIQTWMNSWQIVHNYTNPMQLESLMPVIHSILYDIQGIENDLFNKLSEVFYHPTVREVIGTLIEPIKTQVLLLKQNCYTQLNLPPNCRALKL